MALNPVPIWVIFCVGLFILFSRQPIVQAGLTQQNGDQPGTQTEKIDGYIEEQMRQLEIPGLAVAIVRGNHIDHLRGYGVADGTGHPITPQTPFLIASLSKSFTALAVMQLVEEGKIDLDAPVQQYLPWFETADAISTPQLTIRHLLHHTSGFSSLNGDLRNLDKNSSEDALEASIRALQNTQLQASPGEQFEYSNTNYDLLGFIVQVVSGKPYEAYIEQHIFDPLEMRSSYTSLREAQGNGLSSGHISFFGMTLNYDRFMPYSRTVVPSAGLFSSAEDMAHFLVAHLNQGRYRDSAVLSPGGMDELFARGADISEQVSYGMGWVIFPFPQAAANQNNAAIPIGLSHGGDWANFKAVMVMIPEQEVGVVVLFNKKDNRKDAEYERIAWNTTLLALGLEPFAYPGSNDFLINYGHYVGSAILLLLLTSFVWSVRILSHHSRQRTIMSQRLKMIFWILFLLDLVLSGYILLIEIHLSNTTLPLTLSFHPEVGLLYFFMLVFTLGWGLIRTILFLAYQSRARVSIESTQ